MKVFFDTNVLASAFTARGLCADLLREVLVSEGLVVSDPVLVELRRVLVEKFGMPKSEADEHISFLKQDSIRAGSGKQLDLPIRDKDDIIILSSAIHGEADFFVTGDKEVLGLKEIGGMRILSPRAFWEVVRSR